MNMSFKKRISELVVTGFFTGYVPWMPGTLGTLIGVVLYILLSPHAVLFYLFIPLMIILSVPLSGYAEKHIFKEKASQHIVVDEILGYLVTMVTFSFDGSLESWKYLTMGFILFRVFDIWKPYPIKKSRNLEGGVGIVMDDILAAVYANLFLQFLRLNPSLLPSFLR